MSWFRPAVRILGRLRFTLLFLGMMTLANAFAGTFAGRLPFNVLNDWGIGAQSVLTGDLSRLLTGIFLSHDLDMLIRQIISAAAVIGYAEWRWGGLSAATAFFALDIGSTLMLLTAIWRVPGMASVAELNDVGMSMGGFGLLGLIMAGMRYRFGLFAFVWLAVFAKMLLSFEPLTDTGHGIALCLGFFVGLFLQSRTRP
jgi:hypothetical protein